jgi:hypothetical protein
VQDRIERSRWADQPGETLTDTDRHLDAGTAGVSGQLAGQRQQRQPITSGGRSGDDLGGAEVDT